MSQAIEIHGIAKKTLISVVASAAETGSFTTGVFSLEPFTTLRGIVVPSSGNATISIKQSYDGTTFSVDSSAVTSAGNTFVIDHSVVGAYGQIAVTSVASDTEIITQMYGVPH